MSIIQANQPIETRTQQIVDLACNVVLVGVWAWLYKRLLGYVSVIMFRSDFRLNQLLLIMVVLLAGWHFRKRGARVNLTAVPTLHIQAITMTLGGAIAYMLCEKYIGINTLSTSFMILGSYGLIGLWMSPHTWRKSLPVAFLIVCVLPFGTMLQTFLGYPMRIITADIVQTMLVQMGIPTITTSTILVTVNGIANIDLPCSGVQSIWTGTMFLMAATWLEKRKLNLKWIGIWLVLMVLLFIANFTRVFTLTILGAVWNWWEIAEIVHVPLGVCGFVFACGGALFLLRKQARLDGTKSGAMARPVRWLAPLLIGIVALMAITHKPFYQPASALQPISWVYPAAFNVTADPLEPNQYELLMRDGADSADRYRFSWRGQTGSIILVGSHTWRAHHLPERCFEVAGHKPLAIEPIMVGDAFSLRTLTLMDTDQTAAFWFQSAAQTTNDYTQRIWADFVQPRDNWVLVSILFDGNVDHESADMQAFYEQLHETVGNQLKLMANS